MLPGNGKSVTSNSRSEVQSSQCHDFGRNLIGVQSSKGPYLIGCSVHCPKSLAGSCSVLSFIFTLTERIGLSTLKGFVALCQAITIAGLPTFEVDRRVIVERGHVPRPHVTTLKIRLLIWEPPLDCIDHLPEAMNAPACLGGTVGVTGTPPFNRLHF